MRHVVLVGLGLVACGPEVVELCDPARTVGYEIELAGAPVSVQVEGDVRGEWSDPEYVQGTLACCYEELGLDGPTDGDIVVTDDMETFSAYFNFFQDLWDPAPFAAGFTFKVNRRGKQALGPGTWTTVVHDPSLGHKSVALALCHELVHATRSGDDGHQDEVWHEVGRAVAVCK